MDSSFGHHLSGHTFNTEIAVRNSQLEYLPGIQVHVLIIFQKNFKIDFCILLKKCLSFPLGSFAIMMEYNRFGGRHLKVSKCTSIYEYTYSFQLEDNSIFKF